MTSYRLSFSDLFFAVLLWGLLILRFGYAFGTNDQVELLPYVLYLHDHSLYAHDLFIQSLHASQPNERTIVAHLLLPFAEHLSPAMFFIHLFNTVLLLLALIKLAGRFIQNRYMAWLAVFISVLVLNDKALGNVDLYSSCVQASDMGAMVIAWSLNIFLDRRYLQASLVMALATFLHVLEGFDVMAALCGVMVLQWLWSREVPLSTVIRFFLIYLFTAGIYLLFIFRAKTAGGGVLPQDELFEIMFAFRHPHHFLFSSFPMVNKVLFALYVAAGVMYFRSRSLTVVQFIAIGCVGLLVYIVGVDIFHVVFVANFQWYKLGQWIKYLGVVGAVGGIYYYLRPVILTQSRLINGAVGVAAVGIAGLIVYWQFSGHFDLGYKQYIDNEVALCKKLRELSPKDAVFIQPFEMSALKFHAQRSSYVEFKAIAKNQKDLKRWYDRIQEVFGLDYHVDKSGFNMQWKADDHLDHLDEVALAKLHAEGVTHMICHTDRYSQAHHLILAENGYYVYEL